jgi:hypothetical protein
MGAAGRICYWATVAIPVAISASSKSLGDLSLHQLPCRFECDPAFGRYVTVRAEAVVLSESAARRFVRVAACFGLKPSRPGRSADWGHGMLAVLLAWACNPARTFRGHYRPISQELWISAMELRSRYHHVTPGNGSLSAWTWTGPRP